MPGTGKKKISENHNDKLKFDWMIKKKKIPLILQTVPYVKGVRIDLMHNS